MDVGQQLVRSLNQWVKDSRGLLIANVFNEYISSVGKSVNDHFKNIQYRYKGNPIKRSINLAPTKARKSKTYLKIAQITLIYKIGDKSKIENYRPISIIPAFSKVVEKLIYTRLMTFLSQYNLIFGNQSSFMKNKSTSVATPQLIDKIITAIENKEYVTGVFLDLEKASDCVNITIKLDNLWNLSIRETGHELIKSYMSNRKQFVLLKTNSGSFKSKITNIKYGGPQDIQYRSDNCTKILYADDTSIVCKHEDYDSLEVLFNSRAYRDSTVKSWLCYTSLSEMCSHQINFIIIIIIVIDIAEKLLDIMANYDGSVYDRPMSNEK
ncbi:uncharacterized protein LOC126297942 [Schistocerca gregaria]|uniref:uncharacterized protein LOC126297942 n=1 Tax=Schistocerca gregaria TaxID=7010 RepID=UPI00211E04C4|nr:uncharacterized protein LOC126297942 [Schistocerca gregaria]